MISTSLFGRLGRDPEQRKTRNGAQMAVVSVAVDTARQGSDEDVEWFSVVAFGSAAKTLLLHKTGDLICVMGKLHRRRYTTRDGAERAVWELTVEAILSARTVRLNDDRKRNIEKKPSTPATASPENEAPFDDDIPF